MGLFLLFLKQGVGGNYFPVIFQIDKSSQNSYQYNGALHKKKMQVSLF